MTLDGAWLLLPPEPSRPFLATTHNPRGQPVEEREVDPYLRRWRQVAQAQRDLRREAVMLWLRNRVPRRTRHAVVDAVACPFCDEPVGKPCRNPIGRRGRLARPHWPRVLAWWEHEREAGAPVRGGGESV